MHLARGWLPLTFVLKGTKKHGRRAALVKLSMGKPFSEAA